MAMMPLSLLISRPIADAFGVRVWYVAGGVLCIVIGLVARSPPSCTWKIIDKFESSDIALKAAATAGAAAHR